MTLFDFIINHPPLSHHLPSIIVFVRPKVLVLLGYLYSASTPIELLLLSRFKLPGTKEKE